MIKDPQIFTILEAYVPKNKWDALKNAYAQITPKTAGGTGIIRPLQSHLVQSQQNLEFWSIISVWQDMTILQQMRQREAVPAGVRIFREVGAEPTLSIFEVAASI